MTIHNDIRDKIFRGANTLNHYDLYFPCLACKGHLTIDIANGWQVTREKELVHGTRPDIGLVKGDTRIALEIVDTHDITANAMRLNREAGIYTARIPVKPNIPAIRYARHANVASIVPGMLCNQCEEVVKPKPQARKQGKEPEVAQNLTRRERIAAKKQELLEEMKGELVDEVFDFLADSHDLIEEVGPTQIIIDVPLALEAMESGNTEDSRTNGVSVHFQEVESNDKPARKQAYKRYQVMDTITQKFVTGRDFCERYATHEERETSSYQKKHWPKVANTIIQRMADLRFKVVEVE